MREKRNSVTRINRINFDSIIRSTKSLKGIRNAEELVDIFRHHNLKICNDAYLKEVILNVGYYHLSGYRRVFLDSFSSSSWSGKFETEASDVNLIELYQSDIGLGKVLLKYANIIERRLKSRSSYFLSKLLGEDFHLNRENFKNTYYWENSFSNTYMRVLSNGEDERNPVILHHEENYDSKLPIWVFFEHISFGDYIKFMKNLSIDVQMKTFDDIYHSEAMKYPIRNYMSAAGILDFLYIVKMVRNRISHLGRVYDWTFHYTIGNKSFTDEFKALFIQSTSDYMLRDILHIFGFFLGKSQFDDMMLEVADIMVRIKENIPSPYSDRIISFMGYLIG